MITLLKWAKDFLLLLLISAFLLVGLWGVRLPFRSVFGEAGPYQLQAFENGLAFFHYGRGVTPFWNISPLNDYVVSEEGTRSALLASKIFDQKQYKAKFTLEKPEGIAEAVKAYFGRVTPWYTMETEDLMAVYETQKQGNDWLIQKTVTWKEPQEVASQGITLWYYGSDVVFDGATLQAFTQADSETLDKIKAWYGFAITPMDKEEWTPALSSGVVKIINPTRPGVLTVKALPGQELWVNRAYRLLEAVEVVNRKVTSLKSTLLVTGEEGGDI